MFLINHQSHAQTGLTTQQFLPVFSFILIKNFKSQIQDILHFEIKGFFLPTSSMSQLEIQILIFLG